MTFTNQFSLQSSVKAETIVNYYLLIACQCKLDIIKKYQQVKKIIIV